MSQQARAAQLKSAQMTHWERIQAAIRGGKVDRVPVSFWRHFPHEDETPQGLAAAMIRWQQTFDFDLVKFMPTGTYGVHDWGVESVYGPPRGGTRVVVKPAVTTAEQWRTLPQLDPNRGALGREVTAIRLAAAELAGSVPILQTVFSPLTTARKLAGDRIFDDMRERPEWFEAGLQVITATTIAFVRANLAAGADGIFFASQCSSRDLLSEDEYRRFGAAYDRPIVDAVRNEGKLTLLHVHGVNIFFELMAQYGAELINWHDRLAWPNLRQDASVLKGALVGGVNEQQVLAEGTAAGIRRQVADALAETGRARADNWPRLRNPNNDTRRESPGRAGGSDGGESYRLSGLEAPS